MSQPVLLVTGDVVLDCRLYGSTSAGASSVGGSRTSYSQQLAGAVQTEALLAAAAAADGHRYATELDLDVAGLEASLPTQLRTCAVWTDQPVRKGATKDRVWRVERHFGYGVAEPGQWNGVLKRGPIAGHPPVLTLIDDGALLFRHGASKGAWPDIARQSDGHCLLNMAWPLCRGDLWPALGPVMDRLIVVVTAADLRRGDVQINGRLSWEQCAEDTVRALHGDPSARDLLCAAHTIVTFGSAGAVWFERGAPAGASRFRLLFDRELLEGDDLRQVDGTVPGFEGSVATGIAHHVMARHARADGQPASSPFAEPAAMRAAIENGIIAGLAGARLRLELGHGRVDTPNPGFPREALGASLAKPPGGFVVVDVPAGGPRQPGCEWTLLEQSERAAAAAGESPGPLTGLAHLAARYGAAALSHVPALRLGPLFTVDRSEIESLRMLDALIRAYEAVKVQPKPLSIGVFGPPGAGKSFGVKALARALLGDKVPFLEFNLAQFKGPDDLIGAFHRVRDAVLSGVTPVAFWDEFDSQRYRWLQYLLAPMQDGAFQEGQITHPIGKCIFVFAGGTSPSLEAFGAAAPPPLHEEELGRLGADERAERRRASHEQQERYREYVLLKGPDFVSRLHGFLNVLGPNARTGGQCRDITWPIRRALILRGILRLRDGEELDIDGSLLNALLAVPVYRHGARSFEKIANALSQGREAGRLNRSALPPRPLLDRETDAAAFESLLARGDAFKTHPDIDALAAAIHRRFLAQAERSRLDAAAKSQPGLEWTIHPSIRKAYDDLDADLKASNRGAARRIPDHLALIGYALEPQRPGQTGEWRAPLVSAIETHVERLAQAEHLGWCAERIGNGWVYSNERDDTLKRHPLLVPWARLSESDRDKDRESVRAIPELLEVARFRAVPVIPGA